MTAALVGPFGRIALETPVFTLGRAPENQLVISDANASGRHAVIHVDGQVPSITDLGSTNGTFLNEKRIERNMPWPLKAGDTIRIGDTTFIYEDDRPVASPGIEPTVRQEEFPPSYPTMQAKLSEYTGYGSGQGNQPSAAPPSFPPEQAAPGTPSPYTPGPQGPVFLSPYSAEPQAPDSSPYHATLPAENPAPAVPSYNQPPGAPGYNQASGPAYQQPWSGAGWANMPAQPSYPGAPGSAPAQPSYPGAPGSVPAQPPYPGAPGSSPAYPGMQPPPAFPFPAYPQQPPPQQPVNNRRKVLYIVLAAVLLLGIVGGGLIGYILTRPKPVITLTSDYKVGTTPAGATSTAFRVSGHNFSGSSAITFLLDGRPAPGAPAVTSDSNGNVTANLPVTGDWSAGNHTLTAKDADNYTTKAGLALQIVPQGQAHTPGPNGAPADDASFTVNATVQPNGDPTSYKETLTVTGKPDPNGGTVCNTNDDTGQPHTATGTSNGITLTRTIVLTCTGTYKGGKLSYTETATSDKIDFANGLSCVARTPYVFEQLNGTFSSANTISGTLNEPAATVDCNNGVGTQTFSSKQGTWTGQV